MQQLTQATTFAGARPNNPTAVSVCPADIQRHVWGSSNVWGQQTHGSAAAAEQQQ